MKVAAAPSVPIRVLIVDDVPTMRALLEELIRGAEGFEVSGMAANVPQARLEVSRRRPDVVLLDEILPGESSLDLLEDLRSSKIPVLFITGNEVRSTVLPAGVSARLAKPTWDSLETERPKVVAALRRVVTTQA